MQNQIALMRNADNHKNMQIIKYKETEKSLGFFIFL